MDPQTPMPPSSSVQSTPRLSATQRLTSLDAYRGFIMLVLASDGFHFAQMARKFPENRAWQFLGQQTHHVEWLGCTFWDMIQPSFMFMVGVAMAYSYAARKARGQSYPRMLLHAIIRSIVLVLLGVFLRSHSGPPSNWTFMDVVSQIGLGYTFLFLLWGRKPVTQLAAAALILVGYWCLFFFYPAPTADYDFKSVGVATDWPHLQGVAAHWDKNTNAAAAFDRWFLNLFPRNKPFRFESSGYPTLNFIPSLATMIFGLLAGGLLRSGKSGARKFAVLVASGCAALALGWSLEAAGVCPIVKVIWTPSWAIYSTGWTLLMLAAFYGVIDLAGLRRWSFPLVIVGMNSIAMYVMGQMLKGWVQSTLPIHFGRGVFTLYGYIDPAYEPVVQSALVLLVLWLICLWMYRQRIFIRI
jgi:heparan-alpha-glucosaminide N-acetyltransferase